MKQTNVKEIVLAFIKKRGLEPNYNYEDMVKEYLKEEGFNGLHSHACSCSVDALFPCDEYTCVEYCQPGYEFPCPKFLPGADPDEFDCECTSAKNWHIGPVKPKEKRDV